MDSDAIRRFRGDLLAWGEENYREYPWREDSASLYEVFVAELFLTQTPADNVAAVYPSFLERFPSLEALATADRDEIVETIEPIGFYNMRADALASIAQEHGELPTTVSELTALPRVGPYVANATLCFAFNEALPIVDRNVDRVYSRVIPDRWPDKEREQWDVAAELLPESSAKAYNLALLDFGAAICVPDPKCKVCFASAYCRYYADRV